MQEPICKPKPQREGLPDGAVLWRAPAKLNLTLAVSPPRADGFHDIDSIAAKITLYDDVVFRPRGDGRIGLTCGPIDCGPAEENLAVRAARLLGAGAGRGADIQVTKRIPPGAGLAGGSSDAAAALIALNELWGLGVSPGELAALAAELGSDVPMFLAGPAVRMRGRGEKIEPIDVGDFRAVVCMPGLHCSTAEMYAAYDAILAQGGGERDDWRRRAPAETASQWAGEPFNDLRPAAERVCPALAAVARRIAEATGLAAHLTGSGSAMFVLTNGDAEAWSALARLPEDLRANSVVVARNPW